MATSSLSLKTGDMALGSREIQSAGRPSTMQTCERHVPAPSMATTPLFSLHAAHDVRLRRGSAMSQEDGLAAVVPASGVESPREKRRLPARGCCQVRSAAVHLRWRFDLGTYRAHFRRRPKIPLRSAKQLNCNKTSRNTKRVPDPTELATGRGSGPGRVDCRYPYP